MRIALMVGCAIVIASSLPMILGKVPPNRLYGFRTRRTLSKPEIWYPANRFAGWALVVAGGVSLATLWLIPDEVLLRPWGPFVAFVAPLLVSLVASLLYLRRLS